jgi:hypothetical protein
MAHSDMGQKFIEKLNYHRTLNEQGHYINPSEDIIERLFPKPSDIIARAEELYRFVESQ